MAIDVDALKGATDLVAVVGSVTPLVKRGTEWVGKCVAHSPDNNPSMYVNTRKGLVHCFSCGFSTDIIGFVQHVQGIDFKAACDWLGAKPRLEPSLAAPPRKVIPPRVTSKPPAGSESPNMLLRSVGPPTRIWPYRDTDGQPLGYVARYESDEGKEIRCWTWGRVGDAEPGWACGHWNAPRPLYGLDRLAARPGDKVVVCEGEKAADAAGRLLPGYVPVAWPAGAHAVHKADWTPLAGRDVLLWPDADKPGWEAMQRVAEILHTLGCPVRIIDPNQMPDGWDAADAETDGWDTARVVEWAKPRAADWTPPQQDPPPDAIGSPTDDAAPTPTDDTPQPAPARAAAVRLAAKDGRRVSDDEGQDAVPMALSESGVAMEFVGTRCEGLRFIPKWKKWAAWDGTRWVIESGRETALQRITTLAHSLKYRPEAAGLTVAGKNKLEGRSFIWNVCDFAQLDRRIMLETEIFDADIMLLNTPGGTVDLRTGKMHAPRMSDYCSRQTTVTPERGPHPLWDQVLNCIAAGDGEITAYMWRWLGYILTGSVREESFLFLHGAPASGKSTFIEGIAEILGNALDGGYAVKTKLDLFLESKHERSGDMHIHYGARFAHASETEEGRHWKASLLKEATGGDTMLGERKYENLFSFTPSHKLVIHGNFRPHLRSADEGVRRRLHLIEYKGAIAEDKRDIHFKDKLRAEYPAILARMIDGCLEWQAAGGLKKPAVIAANVSEYFDAEDVLGAWMEECVTLDSASTVLVADVYDSYTVFAEKQGERPCSKKRLSTQLQAKGFAPTKKGGSRALCGFRLNDAVSADKWGARAGY